MTSSFCNKSFLALFLPTLLCLGCEYKDDDHSITLGKGYSIERYGGGKVINSPDNTLIIFDDVVDWEYDSTYILAYRKLTEEGMRRGKGDQYYESQNNGDTVQYWIVDKSIDNIYGPLNKSQYDSKRIVVGIPSSLKLKIEK